MTTTTGWHEHSAKRRAELAKEHTEMMNEHPRAWTPWSEGEVQDLINRATSMMTPPAIAFLHERTTTAVVSKAASIMTPEQFEVFVSRGGPRRPVTLRTALMTSEPDRPVVYTIANADRGWGTGMVIAIGGRVVAADFFKHIHGVCSCEGVFDYCSRDGWPMDQQIWSVFERWPADKMSHDQWLMIHRAHVVATHEFDNIDQLAALVSRPVEEVYA